MCDLGLTIAGTPLEPRIDQAIEELAERKLKFRPHFWLSDEWFTPDGIPGVAIPFYLAHPRLCKLEETLMLEVEGGTRRWCMQLLRHEIGHAIDNAFRLNRKKKWQQVFGKGSQPYPDFYEPRPFSRQFVIHLDYWYAQSHPSEDFAETFAVWLTPGSHWRKRYGGWRALKKLEFVDALMRELAGVTPPVRTRTRDCPLETITKTLREHYDEKRARYGVDFPDFYDRDLRRLFSDAAEHKTNLKASTFLRRHRSVLRRLVARWTGEFQYTIDQVLGDMISRTGEMDLHLCETPEETLLQAAVMLSVQTMNYLHGGHHRIVV